MGVFDQPFGGVNFIFLGDFAQLPPVVGSSLYARNVGNYGKTEKEQSASLGKAIWHQVNRVVILRKNVRMSGNSFEDVKMRTALDNMRYKACTIEDLTFLRTLLHANPITKRSISDREFRNISVITPFHVYREEFNRLGAIRFASENGRTLMTFFSDDSPTEKKVQREERIRKGKPKPDRSFSEKLQDMLWSLPSNNNDSMIAGQISLCIDMPVMIRQNLATELNITKGQQGTVYAWTSGTGSRGQAVLETVFVLLQDPPTTIQFPNLPQNVVPVPTPTEGTSITISLPDGSQVDVNRKQALIWPNFSMTGHCSQGMSRRYNPVFIDQCPTNNGIYTALSRSTCATGTLILRDFNMEEKLMGGLSGDIRQ
ncbi:hypothetical protein CYLTODRAFT_361086, partial [Cylindrobasidium torrendii FP15055 ss-10]